MVEAALYNMRNHHFLCSLDDYNDSLSGVGLSHAILLPYHALKLRIPGLFSVAQLIIIFLDVAAAAVGRRWCIRDRHGLRLCRIRDCAYSWDGNVESGDKSSFAVEVTELMVDSQSEGLDRTLGRDKWSERFHCQVKHWLIAVVDRTDFQLSISKLATR